MNKDFDINALKKEMHYHPPWYNDEFIFFKLLNKKTLTQEDYVTLSRLYIRYNHLDRKYLNRYFNIMLNKINKKSIQELLQHVCKINIQST